MPLKVDSLVANVVESKTIVIEGAPASVLPTTIGNMYPDATYKTIGSVETIMDTLLVPANFLSGVQRGTPLIELVLDLNTSSEYSDLTVKMYLNSTPEVGGVVIFDENFSSGRDGGIDIGFLADVPEVPAMTGVTQLPTLTTPILTPTLTSPVQPTSTTLQVYGELITFQSDNIINYIKYNKTQVVTLTNSNFASAANSGTQMDTYENFDVTTNQYLIITTQKSGSSLGVRLLATIVNTTGGGRFARPMA